MSNGIVDSTTNLGEGPLLFKGDFYLSLKNKMHIYIDLIDLQLLKIFENSYKCPIKYNEWAEVKKLFSDLKSDEK